jgi:hypothetical protein
MCDGGLGTQVTDLGPEPFKLGTLARVQRASAARRDGLAASRRHGRPPLRHRQSWPGARTVHHPARVTASETNAGS